jgi:cytochrome c-type biogenesis protein CcmE
MTHLRLKLTLAGLVLASAVGYLAFAGVQKGWVYTLGVDQYATSPDQQAKRVRLCGKVGEEQLDIRKAQLAASFQLKGEKEFIPVAYKGVIPDMFKAGSEVVVEGKRDGSGVFQADLLITKCASKYEEMPANHPGGKGTGAQP